MKKKLIQIALVLHVGFLFFILLATEAAAQSITWVQHTNPSGSVAPEAARGVAYDSSGIYIVGSDNAAGAGDPRWHIEKRSLSTGGLIWMRTSNNSTGFWAVDAALDVAVDSSGVYIVGLDSNGGSGFPYRSRIEKRSLSTGALIWVQTREFGPAPWQALGARAVVADGSGVYVVGGETVEPGCCDSAWVMEKRSPSTGSVLWSQLSSPGGAFGTCSSEFPQGVTVDGSGVYIVGNDEGISNADSRWRIEKRSLGSGSSLWAQVSNPSSSDGCSLGGADKAYSVSVYGSGVYIAGYAKSTGLRIERRTTGGGSSVWTQTGGASTALGVDVDGDGVYVSASRGSFLPRWVVQKRTHGSGAILWDEENPSSQGDYPYDIEVGGGDLYVVGNDRLVGNSQWRIEKRGAALPPTASLSASPSTITQGQSATLTWSSTDATSCSGSGTGFNTGGATSGSDGASPLSTETYTVTCTGPGGTDSASRTITVLPKNPDFSVSPSVINEGDPVTISWTCYYSSSSSGSNFSTGGATSGSTTLNPGPSTTTTYQVNCNNGGSASRTVTVRPVNYSINANPKLIKPDETSDISWSASGVNSCTVFGPSGFFYTAPPPDLPGGATWSDTETTPSLEEQNTYTLECKTAINTYTAQVTVNVVPTFHEE